MNKKVEESKKINEKGAAVPEVRVQEQPTVKIEPGMIIVLDGAE